MIDEDKRSALMDIVRHEHDHLKRLFEDIASSFEKIADEDASIDDREQMLASASGDLGMALEEMLHHFNQEEEVFFVDLEERFPELGDDVEQLAEAHETMCDKTRWLKRRIGADDEDIAEDLDEILDVLREMVDLLDEHTREENRIFGLALEKVPEAEQQELLDEMRKI
jgi:hemerythrin-like domain-containing protein